nr:nucleic acid-binding, OB-fold protein [Tanacetum cinerariifolium]
MDALSLLFRGKTVVLGGDFRQTLPVKKGAGKDELIIASIIKSHLWWHFKICTLNENMRLLRSDLTIEKRQRSKAFSKWLLDVGNGEIGELDEEDGHDNSWIAIMPDYLNNAIQANMDINNIDYFDPMLKPQVAYRFSNFICEKTKPYQQTLMNQISLKFRKITNFETLTWKKSEFPEYHFEFITHNQLPSRVPYQDENLKIVYPILTGCIRSISDVLPSGDASTTQKYKRKVDIENVEGNITEFTMWDELAKQ